MCHTLVPVTQVGFGRHPGTPRGVKIPIELFRISPGKQLFLEQSVEEIVLEINYETR